MDPIHQRGIESCGVGKQHIRDPQPTRATAPVDRATNDSAAVLAIPGSKGTGSPVLEPVDRRAVRTATSFDLAPTELAVPRPEDPQCGYDQDMSSTRQSGHETFGLGSS